MQMELWYRAMVQVRIDYGQWDTIGNVKGLVTEIHLKDNLRGHIFEFRLTDRVSGEQVKIRGLDFPAGTVEIHESYN